ncbi:MAG: hypothetical protein LBF41_05740, partial [Deltaproteobacteria bacterium]|nr:hypothetical protein [Deltaproteobacteria bacterium]
MGPNPPDPETLASLMRDPRGLNAFESDASIVFHDGEADALRLARDPAGASPLFWAPLPDDSVAVAFDLPSLFKVLPARPALREDTFHDFLATHYRYVFRDNARTFHEGVFQVPAGHALVANASKIETFPWLDLSFDPEAPKLSFQGAADRYLETLRENTVLRLGSLENESFAFAISSGLDSATVASLAARELGTPLDVFCAAYSSASGTPYDETPAAKALADAKGWRFRPLELGPENLLSETTALAEKTLAPLATVTWLAHHALAKYVKALGFDHLFSGLGGDESLAGEFEHFFLFFADLRAASNFELLERET